MNRIKTVSVIGLGKLGLPLCCAFATKYKVIGIDNNEELVSEINRRYYEPELTVNFYYQTYKQNCKFTTSFKELGDITFVIVPTPSKHNRRFDSSLVDKVLKNIHKKQIVVIISTLMPGETDKLQKRYPRLSIIYSPTFVALGSVIDDFLRPDFVLVGTESKKSFYALAEVYRNVLWKYSFCLMTPIEAEIAKIAINCYITTKITFANQIGNICYRLGIPSDKICNAMGADSRIGGKYLKPGLGYGGPCFPRDNLAFSAFMKSIGIKPVLSQAVDRLNNLQIKEFIKRIDKAKVETVGFKSLSYKKGSDVTEKSALKEIYDKLKLKGKYNVKMGNGDITLDWGGIIQ
jgi:UDPglucose 6-dehydrogenase